MKNANRLFWILLLTAILSTCSDTEDGGSASDTQKTYFLESLNLVEQAGRELQSSGLTQAKIINALKTMDQGLKLAFQVEKPFLDALDAR